MVRGYLALPAFLALFLASCGTREPLAPPAASGASTAKHASSNRPASGPPRCLSIVAWNDVHGQIVPDEVPIDTGPVLAGGVIAMADQLAAVRAGSDSVVVLDAGDLFTGPPEATLAEGAPIIRAFNVLGVDAAAIGNHEFDFGPVGYARITAAPGVGDEAGDDGPRGALLARMREANFPFLSANIHRSEGASLDWPHARPSVRISRGGFDVGVVGYTTTQTPTTTVKPNVVGLDFSQGATASVAAEVRALRAAGAAPVVLLAHASLEGPLPMRLDDSTDPHGTARVGEIATLLDGMGADRPDVIIAGHRHAWMLGRVRDIPIVSSDQHGVGLAVLRFCRARPGAPPVLESIERRVALANSPPVSALGMAVAAAVAPWEDKNPEIDALVATLQRPCAARALDGTAMAEQIARAMVEHASDCGAPPRGVPVVGLVNAGGLRMPLPAGPIRYGQLFTAFPFENAIAACVTTRGGLARVVANAVKKSSVRERFPFAIAGAKVALKRDHEGKLEVMRMDIDGIPAKGARDDAPVWLVIPDFILWGGDALLEGVTCTATATSVTRVRDAWRAVLGREQACEGGARNLVFEGE
jgi:5'-nucleotidase